MTDDEEKARVEARISSCAGQQCIQIDYSFGSIAFTFANGVTLDFNDGFCYATLGEDTVSGGVYIDKVVKAP